MNDFKFEKVSCFKDVEFAMPCRKTAQSAGYDMVVAEDVIIPSYNSLMADLDCYFYDNNIEPPVSLEQMAKATKITKAKPTLVSTGVKAKIPEGYYLQLSVRSSCPLKYWLVMANSNGIIDADYYNNVDNEGLIFFQIINFSPVDIELHKGDIIGQAILLPYGTTTDDIAVNERIGGLVQLAYNLLALDQSSQTSGWSHFVDGELANFGKFTFSDADIGKRLCKVRDKIIELINQYDIDEVAFEDIQLQKDVQTFKVLAEVYGIVYQLCRELQIPCKSYLSTVWKSKVGIKGKDRGEQKRNAQKYVFERYGKKVTQDEADAVCIGICASMKEPEPFNWA